MSIKSAALKNGFRTKKITVPEWDDATIIIREPSSVDWFYFQEQMPEKKEGVKGTLDDLSQGVRAEAQMFAHCILDEDGERIFSDDELEELIVAYGPIHTRIMNQAIRLAGMVNPVEDAEKK